MDKNKERRESQRYNTEVKIYFEFAYDLETKVKFEFIDEEKKKRISKKYSAVSQNISVEGLCFITRKEVQSNDLLHCEVYLPSTQTPIHMTGYVKWCKPIEPTLDDKSKGKFHVGLRLLTVDEKSVSETVHFDKEYDVKWSVVLESVFENYKMLMGGKFKKK